MLNINWIFWKKKKVLIWWGHVGNHWAMIKIWCVCLWKYRFIIFLRMFYILSLVQSNGKIWRSSPGMSKNWTMCKAKPCVKCKQFFGKLDWRFSRYKEPCSPIPFGHISHVWLGCLQQYQLESSLTVSVRFSYAFFTSGYVTKVTELKCVHQCSKPFSVE